MEVTGDESAEKHSLHLDDLMAMWEKDAQIDKTNLAEEALRIPLLHHTYSKLYVRHIMILRKLEGQLKKLRLEKAMFYQHGPSSFKEARDANWKLPPQGKVLKSDVEKYVDADDDVIKKTLSVAFAKEKAEFLESVLKTFRERGFNIRTALDFLKFQNGQ
jgi:hypothetical protein